MGTPLPVRFRMWVLLALAALASPLAGAARDDTNLVFEQDLESFGHRFHLAEAGGVIYNFTDLVFLSDQMLLVAVKEIAAADFSRKDPPILAPPQGPMISGPAPTSVTTLYWFDLERRKLVLWARLPDRRMEGAIAPARNHLRP